MGKKKRIEQKIKGLLTEELQALIAARGYAYAITVIDDEGYPCIYEFHCTEQTQEQAEYLILAQIHNMVRHLIRSQKDGNIEMVRDFLNETVNYVIDNISRTLDVPGEAEIKLEDLN